MAQALIILGQADAESFNHRLANHYAEGYHRVGGAVARLDLADLRFDPVMRAGYRKPQTLEPDLLRAKAAIEAASHVVWIFPTYWASPPAVVLAFFARLFLPGWAFKYEGESPLPVGLMRGRSSRVVVTMDAPWFWYTLVNHRCIHRSFGTASLKLCGFAPLAFTTIYSMRKMPESVRQRWCERVALLGEQDALRCAPSSQRRGE